MIFKKTIVFGVCALSIALAFYCYTKKSSNVSEIMMFKDRKDAGQKLLARIQESSLVDKDTIVVALPRGGVPVAYEIAQGLKVPLTTFIVRKIGAPHNPEFAIGALAQTGYCIIDHDLVKSLSVSPEEIEQIKQKELKEAARRQRVYQAQGFPSIEGKTVIVVDDGIATGSTMLVALKALKALNPRKLIVAIPVAPPDSLDAIKKIADTVIVLSAPASFGAVGSFYQEFPQVEDDEVLSLLQ